MIELTPGTTYELKPAELLSLIQQYDYFMVVTFDRSVWVRQRGSMKHPWWNCATPSTNVLLHTDRIEPSFAACATIC